MFLTASIDVLFIGSPTHGSFSLLYDGASDLILSVNHRLWTCFDSVFMARHAKHL